MLLPMTLPTTMSPLPRLAAVIAAEFGGDPLRTGEDQQVAQIGFGAGAESIPVRRRRHHPWKIVEMNGACSAARESNAVDDPVEALVHLGLTVNLKRQVDRGGDEYRGSNPGPSVV